MAYFRASILEYIRESEAVLAAEELTDHEKDAVEAMLNRLAEIAIGMISTRPTYRNVPAQSEASRRSARQAMWKKFQQIREGISIDHQPSFPPPSPRFQ